MERKKIYDPNVRVELPEMRPPLEAKDVEAARKVIGAQKATAPDDGDLSPSGALRRATGVVVGGFGYDSRTHLGDMEALFDGWPHGGDGPRQLVVES